MDFLSKNAVGIDISDYTIEVVEMKRQNQKNRVVSMGRAILEPGTVKKGIIQDKEKLKIALQKAMNKAKPKAIASKKVIFVMPECQVFSFILNLEINNEKKIEKNIEKKVSENIPIKNEDIIYSYKIIDKIDKKIESGDSLKKTQKTTTLYKILIIATSNEIVLEWNDFFSEEMNMDIDIIDTEPQAIHRGLVCDKPSDLCCFVDIGADSTNISVFQKDILYYSYTFSAGGNYFTKNIAEIKATADGEKLGLAKAEVLKLEHGLSEGGEYSKEINLILKNGLRTIAEEIKIAIQYVKESYGLSVKEVVLVGGSAKLKGIQDYFLEYLRDVAILQSQEREKENSQSGDSDDGRVLIKIGEAGIDDDKAAIEYIEAIGAGIRGVDSAYKNDLEVTPRIIKKKKNDKGEEKKELLDSDITEDEEEAVVEVNWFKSHPKEIQLIVILALGLLLIPAAFWYRGYQAKKMQAAQSEIESKFEQTVTFDYKIPIITESSKYSGNSIRGRVIKNVIEQPTNYENALKLSKTEAEKEKKDTEAVWDKPLNEPKDKESLIFPFEVEWMLYSESNAKDLFLKKAKQETPNKFLLNSIDYLRISKDEIEEDTYYLEGSITILSSGLKEDSNSAAEESGVQAKKDDQITESGSSTEAKAENTEEKGSSTEKTIEEAEEDSAEPKEMTIEELMASLKKAKEVEILETGLGYLNVRKGPSIADELVIKVYPGEKYEKTEEEGDWVKIKISDTEEGWVSAKYVK